MALHTLENDGNMGWTCPCGRENSAHTSHEGVQHISEEMVALPACDCGKQTHLVVRPDMPNIKEESIAIASRHMQLADQLAAAGKGPETIKRPELEPMIPLSQVEAAVQRFLASGIPVFATENATPQLEEIVKRMLGERAAEDTSPRLKAVKGPAIALDSDGVANWSCPTCSTRMAKSIRNGDFTWLSADTIGIPACGACGNKPTLQARQYSELATKLQEIGKAPQ